MKKLLIAGAALAALIGTPALAADMAAPVYKAPPPLAPMFSWTGFYVGVNGGSAGATSPVTLSRCGERCRSAAYFVGRRGVRGTTAPPIRRAGYSAARSATTSKWSEFRRRHRDRLRLGRLSRVLERLERLRPVSLRSSTSAQQKLTSLGTFRGRLGFAADHALFYGTGGLAYGRHPARTPQSSRPFACGPAGLLRRVVVDAMADRLDRRRRYGIRLCRGMDCRQDRIPALRSRQPHAGTIRS